MSAEELRVGVFVCDCGLNIAGAVDTGEVTEYAKTLPDVVCVVRNKYTCADPGQNEIKDAIRAHKLNRVVVASCTPRQHEPTFRQCVLEGGLNPYLMEMANLREHCSWVHPGRRGRGHRGGSGARGIGAQGHPGREAGVHRWDHGAAGQDVSHHGLLDMNFGP